MNSVGLVGGRGYVGEQLLGLLASHPTLKPQWVASRSLAGQSLATVYPELGLDLEFAAVTPKTVSQKPADVIVLALANGEAAAYVEALPGDQRILDLSADYRFDPHWCYGLPERNRESIKQACRISNPGCYATAAQLALLPLLDDLAAPPCVFGVSGYSGAGRTPSARNDPDRLLDNLLPYSLSGHIHEHEISTQLGWPVRFMPHVAAFFRGISLTVAATLKQPIEATELHRRFDAYYANEELVEVTGNMPEVKRVADTPRTVIGGFTVDQRDRRQISLVACLDNLLKGAASQALQNINLMLGLDELTGIEEC